MTALSHELTASLETQLQFLSPTDDDWLALASNSPQANIFHHPAWLKVLAACYGYRPFILAIRDTNGAVAAGLPMMDVSSPITGRRWVSLPFTDYCQPLYRDAAALELLTRQIVARYLDGQTPRVEIRWELPAHASLQSSTRFAKHTLALDADAEQVKKCFHRTQRQNIGTAEKKGVRIEWAANEEQLRKFYRLQLCTRRRQGVPVQPWRFFDLLWREVIQPGRGFILLAYKDDECLAGGVFLHWQQTLIYKYAASAETGQELRPNNLLTWTAIQWACEHGFKSFCFGRSALDNEGLLTFKRRWGAEENPLVYSLLARTTPSEGHAMMDTLGTVIRKSPLWVCRLTGELLYRHVG